MKQIKYRAWDTKNKVMESPASYLLLTQTGKVLVSSPFQPIAEAAKGLYVIQFFTGLLDKNGVEIFEGDVVVPDINRMTKGVVEWFTNLGWDGGGSLHSGFYCKEWFTDREGEEELDYGHGFLGCEVIGNVHENPELL